MGQIDEGECRDPREGRRPEGGVIASHQKTTKTKHNTEGEGEKREKKDKAAEIEKRRGAMP